MASVSVLPDECLRHIFSYISLLDLLQVERVCNRWRYIGLSMWRYVHKIGHKDLLQPFPIANLKIFTINDLLQQILIRCGEFVTEIHLVYNRRVQPHLLCKMIPTYCPNLEIIDYPPTMQIPVDGLEMLSTSCPNIKNIIFPTNITEDELINFFRQNRKLEKVTIYCNHSTTGSCLIYLPPTLQELIISRCNYILELSFLIVALQKRLKNVNSLGLNSCLQLTREEFIEIIVNSQTVQKISLQNYPDTWNNEWLLPIVRYKHLRELSLSANSAVSDTNILEIAENCLELEKLDISHCSNRITQASLYYISKLPNLKHLSLSKLDFVTIDSIAVVIQIGLLQSLAIRYCRYFENDGVALVVKNCVDLKYFDVRNCPLVTKESVKDVIEVVNQQVNKNKILTIDVAGTGILKDSWPKHPLVKFVYHIV